MKIRPLTRFHALSFGALVIVGASANADIVGTITAGDRFDPIPAASNVFLTGNHSNPKTSANQIGNRELRWDSAINHSLIGQNFTLPGVSTATVNALHLHLWGSEDFSAYDAATFSLKIFEGDDTDFNAPLETYSFDATALGDISSSEGYVGTWLRFELTGGLVLDGDKTYSFLMVMGAENVNHRLNFRRNKQGDRYNDGGELRGKNTYPIDDWSTNPWNTVAPLNGQLWFFIEGEPEYAGSSPVTVNDIAYSSGPDEVSLSWDSTTDETFTVNWSADLTDFSGVVDANVAGGATSPFTFSSPSPGADQLFFKVSDNAGGGGAPAPIFSEDFESGGIGWTSGVHFGDNSTKWELGPPTNVGPSAAASGSNCYGTNIDADYTEFVDGHVLWLRSPTISLPDTSQASLTFKHFRGMYDGDANDFGSVRILDASDDSELAVIDDFTIKKTGNDWESTQFTIPGPFMNRDIKVEFEFDANLDANLGAGWYIDDVEVVTP